MHSTHVEVPDGRRDASILTAFLSRPHVPRRVMAPVTSGSLCGWTGPRTSDGPMDPREFAFTNPTLHINPHAVSMASPAGFVTPHLQMPLQMPSLLVREHSQIVQTGIPGTSAPSTTPTSTGGPHGGSPPAGTSGAAEACRPSKGRKGRRSATRPRRQAQPKASARRAPKAIRRAPKAVAAAAAAAPSPQIMLPERARSPLPDPTPIAPKVHPRVWTCAPAGACYQHAPLPVHGSDAWSEDLCGAGLGPVAEGGYPWSDVGVGLSLSLPSDVNLDDTPSFSCDQFEDEAAAADALNDVLGTAR